MSGISVAILLSSATVLASLAAATVNDTGKVVILGSTSLGLLLASLGIWCARVEPSRSLRMGPLMLGYAAIAFGFATITILETGGLGGVVETTQIPAALALAAISYVAFSVGYLYGPHAIVRQPMQGLFRLSSTRRANEARRTLALIGVYLVAVGSQVLSGILRGGWGYLGNTYISDIASAGWYVQPLRIVGAQSSVVVFLLACRALREPSSHGVLIAGLLASAEVFTGVLSGMKEPVVTTCAVLALAYFRERHRPPIIALAIVAALYATVLTPFISGYREAVRGDGDILPLGAALSVGLDRTSKGELSEDVTVLDSAARFRQIDNLAAILDQTPTRIAYRPSLELAAAPVQAVVPRVLWAGKPVQLNGREFYQQYYGGETYSSSAVTLPGSLYLYGGVWVAVLGMWVLGGIVRGLDDSIDFFGSLHGAVLFVILAPVFIKQELDVASLISEVPVLLAVFALAMAMSMRRSSLSR